MKSKCAVVAVGVVLCFGIVMLHSRRGNSGKKSFRNFGGEDPAQNFAFTNFEKSQDKTGEALWESIEPGFACPDVYLSRVGRTGDGGKYVCGLKHLGRYYEQNPGISCAVYSFGVSSDSSFESEVLKNTRCSVYAYDPTVDRIGRPLKPSNPRVHFFKMGVGGNDTDSQKTLKTMMEKNGGHDYIDIVKMDVEGSEFSTLDKAFQDFDKLPIGQLLIEMHYDVRNVTWAASERILNIFKNLEERGLRMFSKEVNPYYPKFYCEFSFVNVNTLETFVDLKKLVIK